MIISTVYIQGQRQVSFQLKENYTNWVLSVHQYLQATWLGQIEISERLIARWISKVCNILDTYELLSALEILENLPSKQKRKKKQGIRQSLDNNTYGIYIKSSCSQVKMTTK